MAEDTTIVRDFRAIPLLLLQEYLKDLGGSVVQEGWVEGPGWQARLERLEDFRLGSLRVGQVRLVLEGQQEAIDAMLPGLERKTLRAGA